MAPWGPINAVERCGSAAYRQRREAADRHHAEHRHATEVPPPYDAARHDFPSPAPRYSRPPTFRSTSTQSSDAASVFLPPSVYGDRNAGPARDNRSKLQGPLSSHPTTASDIQRTNIRNSSHSTAGSDVDPTKIGMAFTTKPEFWDTFDWVQLAAVAMQVDRNEVAYTPCSLFLSIAQLDYKIKSLLRSYTTLRADIKLYGSKEVRNLLKDFDGKLVDFFKEWENGEL